MQKITIDDIKTLYIPPSDSHKGQNGRLLIIGGSHLFHAASLWALTVASRIIDLVHYASVPENNELVTRLKQEFRNGIVIPRQDIERYIEEDDVTLIGPGMVRTDNSKVNPPAGGQNSKLQFKTQNLEDILAIQDEGEQTEALTNYLLSKYPQKQWVIDAGALQMMDGENIPKNAILTPHHGEFEGLWKKIQNSEFRIQNEEGLSQEDKVSLFSKTFHCTVLVKGQQDIACNGDGECRMIEGGNAGMTKGGTGDVLAGLIAALACKNDPFLSTIAGSFINKKAGDELYKAVGPFFNATDLANEIPKTMKELLIKDK